MVFNIEVYYDEENEKTGCWIAHDNSTGCDYEVTSLDEIGKVVQEYINDNLPDDLRKEKE